MPYRNNRKAFRMTAIALLSWMNAPQTGSIHFMPAATTEAMLTATLKAMFCQMT
jgi:hypothetical protein